jgi:lipid-binding SYLF domain-containing protein
MERTRRQIIAAAGCGLIAVPSLARAASTLDSDAAAALRTLYATEPKARTLGKKAKAILVFPKIFKAGFVVGGLSGDGALTENGRVIGHYNISAASYGLQAGAQKYSYALFFMNADALKYLDRSDGWALGSGPSVVLVDKGAASSLTTTTLTQDVYAVPFGQRGLMAGIGLEGSKITRINS